MWRPPIWGGNPSGYITPAVLAAHMWAKRLHNPCRFGGTQRGEEIWGPNVGKVAT